MLRRAALYALASTARAGVAHAGGSTVLEDGAYEVNVRLELPHIEQWAAGQKTTICLPRPQTTSSLPLPVLSANNPLANCPATNVERMGNELTFSIICDGRGAARAHAVYALSPREFKGRILMIMGGKNMVMTEVQTGRRIGECAPGAEPHS
jgi:hypothetical protein